MNNIESTTRKPHLVRQRSGVTQTTLVACLLTCGLLATTATHAAMVVTDVVARVSAFAGPQLPTALAIGDTVTFQYRYDTAGTEAHQYYLSGYVDTVPISTNPHLSALSDASVTFSPNMLTTFGEYLGNNGYSYMRSDWFWVDRYSGASYILDLVPPSANVYLSWPGGESGLGFGHVTLFGVDPLNGNNIWGNTISLSFTSLSTTVVPLPGGLGLFCVGLAGFIKRKRFVSTGY